MKVVLMKEAREPKAHLHGSLESQRKFEKYRRACKSETLLSRNRLCKAVEKNVGYKR
jgi:hypothetical protein